MAQKISARERRLSIDEAAAAAADHDEEDEESLTEEEKQRRREFESKRKSHYNEFQVEKQTSFPQSTFLSSLALAPDSLSRPCSDGRRLSSSRASS